MPLRVDLQRRRRTKGMRWLLPCCTYYSLTRTVSSFSVHSRPQQRDSPSPLIGAHRRIVFRDSTSSLKQQQDLNEEDLDENAAWDLSLALESKPYVSTVLDSNPEWRTLLESSFDSSSWSSQNHKMADALWEQIRVEATHALGPEPEAGPQLYSGILSQKSLVEAMSTIISHEIETELMPATALKNLFLEQLTQEDAMSMHLDVMAVVLRSSSVGGNPLMAVLFHQGLHALVCYRVGHRLWQEGRTGLAYYMQSTVSRKYSADIHPACKMGSGIYLNAGGGVVIGETAVIGQDVSILQGVTLGGTGKEAGDRHPKVGNGVILHDGATVLGNIQVGDGAVVTAKSIVTKPVPCFARVSGVPAKIVSFRQLTEEEFASDELQHSLGFKYMRQWQEMATDNTG